MYFEVQFEIFRNDTHHDTQNDTHGMKNLRIVNVNRIYRIDLLPPYGYNKKSPLRQQKWGFFLTVILASPVNTDTAFYQIVSSSSVLRIMSSDC